MGIISNTAVVSDLQRIYKKNSYSNYKLLTHISLKPNLQAHVRIPAGISVQLDN